MKQRFASAIALGAALAVAGLPAAQSSEESEYFRVYQRVMDGMQAGECKAHLAKGMELAASPTFESALSRQGRATFLTALIDCAYEERDPASALAAARIWHGFDPGNPWVQAVRLDLGAQQQQPAVTVEAFMTLVRIAPDYLNGLEVRDIQDAIKAAEKLENPDDRQFEMHQALLRIGYAPAPPERDDLLRLEHAELLLARGDPETARSRLAGVSDLSLLLRLRVDRQFDVLRGDRDFEAKLDLAAAAERNVENTRRLMTEQPDVLQFVEEHVAALYVARGSAEALAAADAAIAKHAANPAAYKDGDDQFRWLLNRRGYLLYDAGRIVEARASLGEAAGLAEHGSPNVSNIINYMIVLVDAGAAKEAAELLPKIGQASPYGQGWIESGRACLGEMLEDAEMRKAGLDWLREHEADNRSAYSRALLCVNALDESAAFFVRRLADPEARGDALLALQDYKLSNDDHLPMLQTLRKRLVIVRARPEVQAAVETVGRIEKVPVHLSSGDI